MDILCHRICSSHRLGTTKVESELVCSYMYLPKQKKVIALNYDQYQNMYLV